MSILRCEHVAGTANADLQDERKERVPSISSRILMRTAKDREPGMTFTRYVWNGAVRPDFPVAAEYLKVNAPLFSIDPLMVDRRDGDIPEGMAHVPSLLQRAMVCRAHFPSSRFENPSLNGPRGSLPSGAPPGVIVWAPRS